jgi:hypothetical protein
VRRNPIPQDASGTNGTFLDPEAVIFTTMHVRSWTVAGIVKASAAQTAPQRWPDAARALNMLNVLNGQDVRDVWNKASREQ